MQTTLLLLAYAPARRRRSALALLVGGRVFAAMKRSLGAGEWIRRGLGVAVLVAVVAIALGLDTGFLTRLSLASTASLEQGLLDKLGGRTDAAMSRRSAMSGRQTGAKRTRRCRVEGPLPSLAGAVAWLNSPPLTPAALRGKVVLVDFWTYSCINCLRVAPLRPGLGREVQGSRAWS